jgi:hypothetical protein
MDKLALLRITHLFGHLAKRFNDPAFVESLKANGKSDDYIEGVITTFTVITDMMAPIMMQALDRAMKQEKVETLDRIDKQVNVKEDITDETRNLIAKIAKGGI